MTGRGQEKGGVRRREGKGKGGVRRREGEGKGGIRRWEGREGRGNAVMGKYTWVLFKYYSA